MPVEPTLNGLRALPARDVPACRQGRSLGDDLHRSHYPISRPSELAPGGLVPVYRGW